MNSLELAKDPTVKLIQNSEIVYSDKIGMGGFGEVFKAKFEFSY